MIWAKILMGKLSISIIIIAGRFIMYEKIIHQYTQQGISYNNKVHVVEGVNHKTFIESIWLIA